MSSLRGLSFSLSGDTKDADDKLDLVTDKIRELVDRVHTFDIDADDLDASIKIREISASLDKIGDKVVNPRISVDGIDKADLAIDKLSLKLDKLGDKGSDISFGKILKSVYSKGALKNLFGNGEGNGESESGMAPEGLGDFLTSPAGLGLIADAAGMLPSLLGGGTALGIGAAGAYGAYKFDPKAFAKPIADLEKSLSGIFKPLAPGFAGILKQVDGFVKQISPELRTMFAASIPALRQFVVALEPAVKQLLPTFTKIINQMAKSGSLTILAQALGQVAVGAAKMIEAMSAGFRESAELVKVNVDAIMDVLEFLGSVIGDTVGFVDELIHGKWSQALDLFYSVSMGAIRGVEGAFVTLWHETVADVELAASGIVRAWHALPGIMEGIGKDIINGIVNGIESAAGGLLSRVEGLANDVSGAFAHVLHILSPSRVFYEHGQNIVRGLVMGLDDSLPMLHSAMDRVSSAALPHNVHGYGDVATAGGSSAAVTNAPLQIEFVGGADSAFWTMIRKMIRTHGGNPNIIGAR